MFKTFHKIEGNKLVLEQRDRKTNELQVWAMKYVNDEGKLYEVSWILLLFILKNFNRIIKFFKQEMTCRGVKAIRIFKRIK